MTEIGIIGSGSTGANIAFFIAEKGVADVCLYDVKEGLSTGKALDMMEAAPIRGYETSIRGSDSLDEVSSADIAVIAAGTIRSPGMKREELFESNRAAISESAAALKGSSSRVIIVTEPVDALTALFIEESGLPHHRVMGLGGTLDSMRLRYLLAEELGVAAENVTATVIGPHSDGMLPLPRYCSVSGLPVDQLIAPDRLRAIFDETRAAGDRIVEEAKRANAYYAPAAAAADLIEAVYRDTRRTISVSLMFTGQYGIKDTVMSLPAVIGREGLVTVREPRLTNEEKKKLAQAAQTVNRTLRGDH